MLNAFYNSLIHDNQVLILEALERLELDYKGGCREESIASIERIAAPGSHDQETDDDAAWVQIIRDLEDVGISHRVALTYHDFVVNWFIRAINEGGLLEERRNPENLSTTRPSSKDGFEVDYLSTSFATTDLNEKNEMVYSENVLRHAPGMAPLQRSDSSNAPEPLHILHASAETINELDLPDLPCDAPEPVHLPSPSTQAPEHMHGKNQDIAGELFQPVYSSSQAPEPVSFATTTDLNERVQKAIDAWVRRDFVAAARLLEEQLAAVEQGFAAPNDLQPDRVQRYHQRDAGPSRGSFEFY